MTKCQDLCSTCMHVSLCINKCKSDKLIYYCEEFEVAPVDIKELQKDVCEKQDENDNSFKGLCINCKNRKTCMLPMPEGGIWHCEEYQ